MSSGRALLLPSYPRHGAPQRLPRLVFHGLSDADIDDFVHFLQGACDIVLQPQIVPIVAADPDDDVVIATAVDGHADAIGTLDHHFRDPAVLVYCQARGIRILADVELVQELRAATP